MKNLDALLEEYYVSRGCYEKTGKPKKEKLVELEIDKRD